jgi:hypothetical protein
MWSEAFKANNKEVDEETKESQPSSVSKSLDGVRAKPRTGLPDMSQEYVRVPSNNMFKFFTADKNEIKDDDEDDNDDEREDWTLFVVLGGIALLSIGVFAWMRSRRR